ncbi:outer membrane beta-barrel protein [Algibacter pectinivorans]|uniref:Outer membrane receptor proteins, mostly Fe transport n=1 Tax=Algibacter pectinivorans TaxID=870482 RepID=A0A1I1PEI6_9FLAO|nr:outer membrane beta-barrel protein [Algibacter pectinivorans]SFD08086.1 Outer membrane receptor proteins, mostly Fe transport [Algibacter pectinivorans]
MFKKIFSFYFLTLTSLCFSQHFVVAGTVVDSYKTPISYANVTIYNTDLPQDINGVITNDNGYFKFDNLSNGEYILSISFLGFEKYIKTLEIKEDKQLGTITLKENVEELNGVTIVAQRPTIKRMVDRLVFNVENSTLSNNNVFDVLKHTPGVLVMNETITVKQGTPTIYINDRRVNLSSNEVKQLLQGTSASNIKSIEVITNPPAKYEAEGGSVINIITSKNIIAGYNGSIYGTYKQGSKFPKYAFGTSHYFKTKKMNFYLNYSKSPKKEFRNNEESVNFFENNLNTTSWDTDFERVRKSSNQNINTNVDYEFNKKNSLSFSASMLLAPRKQTQNQVNSTTRVFNANKILDSTFITNNLKVDENLNLAFTLDYIHKFNKEGEKLSVNTHHTAYSFSSFQDVDTKYFLPDNSFLRNNNFQTFSSQEIKLYTSQMDYELPIDNSTFFESGIKVSSINSKSELQQNNIINGLKVEDIENSDVFLYDETNFALYTSLSKEWNSWDLKVGLRTEFTNIKGNSLSSNTLNNNKYTNFFPSLHLLHTINDKNEIYLNYNKRIYRPRYNQLNPYKYFLNDNSYITGNPNLVPQIDDAFTLGYTINQKYTFEAYYRYENNPTIEITFQDNTNNILKYVNTNIDRNISYGLDFTSYTAVLNNYWNIYLLSSIFYYDNQFFAIESENALVNKSQWSLYGQIINYFSFLKDKSLTADVSLFYLSSIVDGPSEYSSRSSLDINFRKTFWNNKASVNAGITDAFNGLNLSQTTKYLNQDNTSYSRIENRLITFGFNYKFGNSSLKAKEKEFKLQERDRLENK